MNWLNKFVGKVNQRATSEEGGMNPAGFTARAKPSVLARKNFNKIFCIGYNKTGTTTLEAVLRLYGYHLPNQQEQEIRLTAQTFATNYQEFSSFVSRYDAFQDNPFSQGSTYVVADALFPDSKFILSEREPEAWFKSMFSFHQKLFGIDDMSTLTEQTLLEKFNYLYPGYMHQAKVRLLTEFEEDKAVVRWDRLYDKDYYIATYLERNRQIKKYFMHAPEKLLVLDVTKEPDTSRICQFLNIPEELVIDMPHANKT